MKTYEKLYLILREKNDYHNGEWLAEKLGISRTAIWKAIKTLESKGLTFSKDKHKGYKLESGDLFIPDEISRQLSIPVTYTEQSQSTQIDAKNNASSESKKPHLFLASQQSQAKGRLNRDFFTSETGGIYMTLHLKPNQTYDAIEPYTMMVASCLVKAISRLTDIETDIKWVNDIFRDGKKVAGILTEAVTSVETGLITDIYIGVGINFYIKQFPKEIDTIATSLFDTIPTITRQDLIIEIWKLFFEVPVADLVKVYKEKSLVIEKQVTFEENNKTITAKAVDITDLGHLVVELEDKTLKTIRSGEVSLSSWKPGQL